MNSSLKKRAIGITLGDQAGIGPEIIEKVISSGQLHPDIEWVVLGDRVEVVPGMPSEKSARAAWDALELAAQLMSDGEIDAVVTAPVSKHELQKIGYKWEGQTEFFAERAGVSDYAMCLSGAHLTVGLVTIHQSIESVPSTITEDLIVQKGLLLAEFARKVKAPRPRVGVLALNPHAGEEGAFGWQEKEVILPAIHRLTELCPWAEWSGPHVPDAVFRDAYEGRYDALLCMYHDQGLIPLKMVDFDSAINITLGLPKPRISPDHGTAFNIAGQGIAQHQSMLNACLLAARLTEPNSF